MTTLSSSLLLLSASKAASYPGISPSTSPDSLTGARRRTSIAWSACVAMLAVAAGPACLDREDDDSAVAELALDAGDSGQSESALLAAALDGVTPGAAASVTAGSALATPAEVAVAINARLAARFSPAGCATSTATGSSLTVTFASCTGPRGLRSVTGTLALSVTSASPTSISLSAHASNFQIGSAVLELDLSATYTTTGTGASLAVESHSGGIGPFGHQLDHSGAYQASWDASCSSVSGAWSTALDGRARSIAVDLRRCAASCATGTVTRTTRDGRVITVVLDGTTASWTSSTGRTGTLALRCGR